MKRVYLDNNATTPLHESVLVEMLPFLKERFGNPSSAHAFGREARSAIDLARARVAAFINAQPHEIVFTSGGTEANNHALRGTVSSDSRRNTLITDTIEHPAVLETCKALASRGSEVTYVPVDGDGRVDPDDVGAAITDTTCIVSVMLANNDVGTIQPVKEIVELARERGVLTHTDAVQAPGKIRIDVDDLGVDFLSISAHKFNGPKGIGALFVRAGTELSPLLFGGAQEGSLRAGTENVAGVVGLGKACEIAGNSEQEAARLRELRDRIETEILERIAGTQVNAAGADRLPNTSSITFDGVQASSLLMNLDLEGVAVSAGSACSSGAAEPSHVLLAMGVARGRAVSTLRFSLGRGNTAEQVETTIDVLTELVGRIRNR